MSSAIPVGFVAQPGHLEFLRWFFEPRAVVLSDVGDPLSMSEEEATKTQPENPLNRIPADRQLATTVSEHGPDGKGNFRVCLLKDQELDQLWKDLGRESISFPPNVIFESSGRLAGDLRNPEPDKNADYSDRWATITTETLTLSKARPCALISVRTVLSRSWQWLFPLVRASDHLRFQAVKLKAETPREMQGLVALGALGAFNATPIGDIGHPLDLGDEEP